MKIKFLGTAAAEGVPALFCECTMCEKARKLKGKNIRTRSQALVNDDLLIDFLITHAHSDHLYSADLTMRSPGYATYEDKTPINIYGGSTVVNKLRENNVIVSREQEDFVKIHNLEAFVPVAIKDYMVTPLEADHAGEQVAFIYLIEKDGKTLLYAHDSGHFPESTMDYLSKSKPHIDFATFDCCYSLRHKDKGHMGFDEVMIMKDRLQGIGVIDNNTICCVNHFSHNNGETYEDMKNHSEKFGILTSYDGMEVEF